MRRRREEEEEKKRGGKRREREEKNTTHNFCASYMHATDSSLPLSPLAFLCATGRRGER